MNYGLAEYVAYFPCPPDSIVDAFDSIPASAIPQPIDSGCGGMCGGSCCGGMSGLTMDGTGLLGTGLFSGGMDLSTWGAGEFAVAAVGVFALYSMLVTTKSGIRRGRVRAKKIKRGFTA